MDRLENMNKRQIEILAPAGSYEAMKAAMNAGCDAVYIGGSSFGARAYADNPDEDTLLSAIDEAHIRDKKIYLTVNTLLKEKERTNELYLFIEKYYKQGIDAIIVQDVGVLHFIHQHFPGLPIHASTQMTLTMAEGANLLQEYGVTRLVTSRELGLKEIKRLREGTNLEIETFVHGALCYSYSGQCLMSSLIGGRSGNRGRCAQPCRMPYQFHSGDQKLSTEQEKFLLSTKDINTVKLIPELVEAGIDSFKIEGRMKRPEYSAAVSHLYRKYVDLYLELGREGYDEHIKSSSFTKNMILLQDIYNRGGFSEGYGKTYNSKKMMSLFRPNHSGVLVGEVTAITGSQVSIALKEELHAQDILEIRHTNEEGYEFTVKDPHEPGSVLKTNIGRRQDVKISEKKASEIKIGDNRRQRWQAPVAAIGDPVYRTKNNALLEHLSKEYIDTNAKLGIEGRLKAKQGEKLSLTVAYRDWKVTVFQDFVQEAKNQPMTEEKLMAPILKTGDTLYYFDVLQVETDGRSFVPVAWLNELRRDAIRSLEETVAGSYRRVEEKAEVDLAIGAKEKAKESLARGTIEKAKEGLALGTTEKAEESLEIGAADQAETSIQIGYTGQAESSIQSGYTDQGKQPLINSKKVGSFGVCVTVQTQEQYDEAIHFPEVTAIYADYDKLGGQSILPLAKEAFAKGKAFYPSLPHICRPEVYDRLEKDISAIIKEEAVTGFIVKNFEEAALLRTFISKGEAKKEIILNYNMYTYNREAKVFWEELGITRFTAPVELNYQELKTLGVQDCDMLVYGYLPAMVSAQCLFESTKGCRKNETNHTGTLTDRLGKNFIVQTDCKSCYNIIFNGQPLALHKQVEEVKALGSYNIRLDFTLESRSETSKILSQFIDTYLYGKAGKEEVEAYTTGHFKRGVE